MLDNEGNPRILFNGGSLDMSEKGKTHTGQGETAGFEL